MNTSQLLKAVTILCKCVLAIAWLMPSDVLAQQDEEAWRTRAKTVQVLDADTYQPLPGVTVITIQPHNLFILNGGEWDWITDEKGEFVLNDWWTDRDTFYFKFAHEEMALSLKDLRDQGYKAYLRTSSLGNHMLDDGDAGRNAWEGMPAQGMVSSASEWMRHGGEAFVQNSHQNAGSPVLRGLEGSRIGITVDGVPLNHPGYSSRHQGALMLIDPYATQALMLTHRLAGYQPQDALGGNVWAFTRGNLSLGQGGKAFGGKVLTRLGTSRGEAAGHLRLDYAKGSWAGTTMATLASIGDVEGGERFPGGLAAWGTQPLMVRQDSLVANPDPWRAVGSGHKAIYLTQTLYRSRPSSRWAHELTFQFARVPEVQRQDLATATTNEADTALAFAEARYAPLQRMMGSYTLHFPNLGKLWDYGTLRVSAQVQSEESHTRLFGDSIVRQLGQRWNGVHADLLFQKATVNQDELYYGVNANYWQGQSDLTLRSTNIGTQPVQLPGYLPADRATVLHASAYATYRMHIFRKLLLAPGLRLHTQALTARPNADQQALGWPSATHAGKPALTGSVLVSYKAKDKFRIALRYAATARYANFDDQLNGLSAGSLLPQYPTAKVGVERLHHVEASLQWVPNRQLKADLSGWVSRHRGGFVADNLTGLAADDPGAFLSLANVYKANLWGARASLAYTISQRLSAFAVFHLTQGKVLEPVALEGPAPHIPPMFGKVGVDYGKGRFGAWAYLLSQGWKRAEQYAASEAQELSFTVNAGTPAFVVPHLGVRYRFDHGITAMLGLDNPMDQQVRYYSSAISQRGRTAWLSLQKEF